MQPVIEDHSATADAVFDEIAVTLREMGGRILQPVENLDATLVGERFHDDSPAACVRVTMKHWAGSIAPPPLRARPCSGHVGRETHACIDGTQLGHSYRVRVPTISGWILQR